MENKIKALQGFGSWVDKNRAAALMLIIIVVMGAIGYLSYKNLAKQGGDLTHCMEQKEALIIEKETITDEFANYKIQVLTDRANKADSALRVFRELEQSQRQIKLKL